RVFYNKVVLGVCGRHNFRYALGCAKIREPKPTPTPKEEEHREGQLRYFPSESRVEVIGKQLLRLEVFDLTGKRLILHTLTGTTQANLSLSTLPRGLYLVRVLDGTSYSTHRIAR
ncbi:MAG: T9SS type A sorting domain-containing protein, partial [Porphyromonas pasteri]